MDRSLICTFYYHLLNTKLEDEPGMVEMQSQQEFNHILVDINVMVTKNLQPNRRAKATSLLRSRNWLLPRSGQDG